MISQEPDPASPGTLVDIKFRLENRKSETQKNVEVKIENKYPFSIYSGEQIKQVGTLAPQQKDETGVRVDYTLKIDKDAVIGQNEIDFYYRIDGGAWIKGGDFTVDVREADAVLAINEIKSDPEKISPGKQTNIRFKLENLDSSTLKDIKLNLELYKETTTATGIVTTELPFTPIGSSNEKTLQKINAGKANYLSFDLFVDASAESKVYKVPYTLTYSDETGINFSRVGIIGLMVDAEPDISISIDQTDIYSAGTKGTVTIKIVNKGFSDIKFVDVILENNKEYEILSNPEVYIGNVDSDDYETADYDLLINNDVKDKTILPISVRYKNANGKEYSKDLYLELTLFTGDELKKRVNGGSNSPLGIIIVIIIVVVGFLFYRWQKKKKKKA